MADDYVVLDDLEGGDLIELEFRYGVRQWVSADQCSPSELGELFESMPGFREAAGWSVKLLVDGVVQANLTLRSQQLSKRV